MSGTKRLFRTMEQVLESVRMAFIQYPFQFNLLSTIWPLVFGKDSYIQQDQHNRSVWAKIPGKDKLIHCDEDDLKERIVTKLKPISSVAGSTDPHLYDGVRNQSLCHRGKTTRFTNPVPGSIPIMADFVCKTLRPLLPYTGLPGWVHDR